MCPNRGSSFPYYRVKLKFIYVGFRGERKNAGPNREKKTINPHMAPGREFVVREERDIAAASNLLPGQALRGKFA